jgi:L-threonylcarbamoyladenylate synthase
MELLHVDPATPAPEPIARAAAVIRRGGLVAFPTETVYGLGADALDATAVRRIFDAKGRPGYNPLIVHVASAEEARGLAAAWPETAAHLAAHFWPGPLTLVVPKRADVPDEVTAGLDSVALRVPSHPVALALLRAARRPIAAPSANRFTQLSPTTAAHVVKGLGERVDVVLDGGPTDVGIESTVVDCTGERPVVLRPGMVSVAALEAVVGAVTLAGERPGATEPAGEAPRRSPGMLDRHYAPRAELRWLTPGTVAALPAGVVSGALLLHAPDPGVTHATVLPAEPTAYARALYAALHRLDDLGCAIVLVEPPPAGGAWAGVQDRLGRAVRA